MEKLIELDDNSFLKFTKEENGFTLLFQVKHKEDCKIVSMSTLLTTDEIKDITNWLQSAIGDKNV